MGRAGGGSRGGGGRSGGGSFSRSGGSFSRSSGSFSRSGGSSFSRSGSGNRRSSSGGGFGGSFGSSHFGGSYHRPPRPIFINPGHGRKTVIINNSGNTTYNGTNTNTSTGTNGSNTYNTTGSAAQTYMAPKPLTPEQKISRAERLAEEAREARKGSVKILLVALILLVAGLFISIKAKHDVFEKYNLKGTVDVGHAYDDGFTFNGGRTADACKEFYQKTGIPLYFYTVGEYARDASTCDIYTAALYDTLFEDENHVLVAYYNNVDWWSWQYGANVSSIMGDTEINDLIDEIYFYWDDSSLSNDAVLAKGISSYQESLIAGDNGASLFAGLLFIAGGVMLIVAVYNYVSKGKEAKRYEEEAKTLRAEQILSKPLETFGDQEIDDLKEKYDKM